MVQRPRVWSELEYFSMTGTRTNLDWLDTVVKSTGISYRTNDMGRYCYLIVTRVSVKAWMASTVDEKVFLVAMSM
jgi:hypothetical protein